MDVRRPLFQAIASALAGILFLNPIVACAAQLAVDQAAGGNTSIGAAGNGVPVVNIATPTGAGLSHNKFSDYNVGQQGLILNNATTKIQATQLGGIIIGNPNLKGAAATRILNEVTGGSPSQLKGYTEVAGQGAHVIVANPHGITCNGCGFINTPRATLSTGKPILKGERLDHYDVDGGEIVIEGAGLNASNVDQFELITRSAKINADLYANRLNIVAGRNQVDAETLAASAKADDGSTKPQLAIDSSALGGMYTGAIRLVGTEAGVGVKLAGNMAASAGDIRIDASGKLSLAQTAASRDIRLDAQSIDLSGKAYAGGSVDAQAAETLSLAKGQSLAARERIALKGGQLDNQGLIEAGVNADNSRNLIGDVQLAGGGLRNSGSVVASRALSAVLSGQVDNRAGTLSSKANTTVAAAGLNNGDDGRVLAQGSLTVAVAELDNRTGLIASGKDLSVTATTSLSNQAGEISSQAVATLDGGNLDNRGGLIAAGSALALTAGNLDNSDTGTLSSQGGLTATVTGKLDNHGEGALLSQGKLTLGAENIDNRQGGLIAATQGLDIQASNSLHNSGGEVSTQGAAVIRVLAKDGQPAALLDNSGAGLVIGDQGLQLTVQRLLNNARGVLTGRDSLVLIGDSLDNSAGGTLSSQTALSVALTGALANREQGALISGGSLTVGAKSLDNSAEGLLSSKGALNVNKGSLDNRGGTLLSDGQLAISNSSLDNSAGGVISAKQVLTIGTGQLDNHHEGLISSGAGLTIASAQLNNHGRGLIAGKGAVQVSASGLDQHNSGELISETALTLDLKGGTLNNSDQGLIATPGALLLNNLGLVDNSAGGEISSAQGFLLKAGELDNRAGRIISSQDLQLQITGVLLNNLKGALSAAKLTVTAASLDNSGAGVLASKGDLEVTLGGKLDNHDQGLISAGEALTVTSASLDNSNKGLLASGGSLTLTTGAVDNQGGSLASQASLNATSAGLDNRGGTLSSQQAFTLTATGVDNRDGGLITSAAGLILSADSLDSSRDAADIGGEVSAKQDLVLTVKKLIQRQGRLIGEAGVSLDLLGGDLDNRGGLLFANGPLTFANLRKLDNRDAGEVSSNQSYSLSAAAIDNGEKGRLISADSLTLELGSGMLRNAGEGLVSGWKGLTVNAGNLDNSGAGTLSSRDGALAVTLSGSEQVLNNSSQGALVSKGSLDVRAKTLNNSGEGILSSAGDLGLILDGKLDNHDGGLIDSQGALTVTAGEVDNQGGQIGSQLAGSLTAASLDNSAGQLSSAAALTLNLTGELLNTRQAQLASAGSLVLKADAIDNRGGSLISQGLFNLAGSSLNNANGGTLAARNALDIVLSGALSNSADGLIHSEQGTFDIQAQSLGNAGGTLHSQDDLTLSLSGTLDNQNGRIESQVGNLHLKESSAVVNSGGVLASLNGWLELVSAGLFDNDAGTAQAQSVKITAKGVDNRAGHLSALSGDTEIIATDATINNQGGGLYADGLLKVTAGDFSNQGAQAGLGGKVAAGAIDFGLSGILSNSFGLIESDSTLSLTAASFNNGSGSLRSLGTTGTTLISGGLLDNRNGLIETANTTLQLDVSGLENAGGLIRHVGTGTFDLSAANVMAAGGTLSTNGLLDITANSWVNSSVLQAGRLTLNIGTFTQTANGQLLASQSLSGTGGTWTNHGLLASDGSLSLTLSDGYSGNGQVTSLGNLSLSAASIDLPTSARISGGGLTTVTSTGLLSNRGKLTSADDLTVRAATLNNYGTLGSAQQLRLYAPTLRNENGLIFSGSDMALRVDNFTNKYADVYSLGALSIAKDDQLARAGAVENISATLESAGHMLINAQRLDNRTDVYSLGRELISGFIAVRCYDCSGNHYYVDYIAKEFYQSSVLEDSPSALITAGGNFNFTGGDLVNRQSSISAAGNITVQATNFSNIGAVGGSIERTRTYYTGRVTDGTVDRFVASYVRPYNQRNNPDFPNVYYAASATGEIRLGVASVEYNSESGIDEIVVTDSITKDYVWIPTGYPWSGNLPSSQYDPNNLLQLPSTLNQYQLVSDVEIASDGGAVRSAIVQAGGNVSIQASQSLENSVIRQDYQPVGGGSRVGDTAAVGTGKTTVVQLNSQLPPDLQQQQINPLTLPGFSLPQGENGLFRLNGQNAAASVASGALGATGDSTLTSSSVTVGAGQAAQGPAMTSGRVWSLQTGQSPIGFTPINAAALAMSGIQSQPGSHNYLIETNPELTSLRSFLGSDYLLGLLGYDPDQAQKRLGDGLYEQRLIQQAVMARTGQRFLAGMTSDEALFKYLMDNAIAYKDQLHLSLGVTLSAAQVAALTHDIVWLEEHEVLGEKVLVPVLYLAQAEGRLAANGALIQGRDVTLISGGELLNQGTLRASESLTATAGNIVNRGLVETSQRLQLLATESIRNAQGGIIAGRDVSLTALSGDVINERSVTRHEVEFGSRHSIQDFVDSAARIEAVNSLSIHAGRDVANLGSVLDSRGDLAISAGRDVTIAEVEERVSQARGSHYLDEHVRQLGAEVSAGRDLQISAGRDLTAIASQIDARRDLALVAGGDVLLAAAANEDHFYSRSKKVIHSTDKIVQQSTTVQAGRDIAIAASEDLTLVASQIKAGNNVSLDAEQDISILSAKDESASFYFKKKKGSFGRSSSKQQEKYDSTNIASVIEAGNDLTLNTSKTADGGMSIDGGRDVTVIGSQLAAGGDLLVGATGDVAVLSGVEEHGSYSNKTKSGFLGLSKSGKSQLKTTASQVASELEAGNDVVIAAGNDIRLRASETTAGNDVELRAGLVKDTGDINLVAANDTAYSLTEQYKKKVGLSTSGGFVSISSAKEAGREAQNSTSVGSQVVAERDAILQAERDINVIGSGISAGRNVSLDAGRDVNVFAAEDSSAQRNWEKNKQVGIGVSGDDNGVSFFVGAERTQEKDRLLRHTSAAGQISAGHDLDIAAGHDINQTGSDLLASNDINLQSGRNINIDAARETQVLEQQRSEERQGLGVTVNHNFGNTKDAIGNAGKGDNSVSQGSSTLKAVDSISQFLAGPTADVRLGNSKQSSSQQYTEQTNRSSTLSAGNDLNLVANNDVTVRGGQLDAGRDINVKGRDVTIDVAQGAVSEEHQQSQSWGGIHGGTSGGFKAGIGGSHGVANEDWVQGTSTATQVVAGRDINLEASNDLSLIGTQAQAGRDIDLKAGNDLSIGAAQNASTSESERRSAGGEVGLTVGSEGIGVYASVNLGNGHLQREGERQQEAYLYAGERLSFSSGKDTTIAGAQLRGDEVIGRVGRDLRVSSLPDTGEVKGKEFDLSATVTIGPGAGVSGSVGYGETTGKTNWVEEQTRITARDRLDIRTENHSQIDGALIASDSGNLKLDTGTLGFSDIAGQDKERSYYLNVGGSYGLGGGATQQDASQVGKGTQGESGWSVEGYEYERDREQIVRATVGAGEIIVRSDAQTGQDSTAGLNRDLNKAYEINRDEEERTNLYASKSSVEAVANPKETLQKWQDDAENYGRHSVEAFTGLRVLKEQALSAAEHDRLVAALAWAPALLVDAMDALNTPTLGIFPGVENHGGLITQLPVLVTGDLQPMRVKGTFKSDESGQLVLQNGKPILDADSLQVDQFAGFNDQEDKIFTNGIMNTMMEALANGLMQSGSGNGDVSFVLAYNPAHGLVGDLIESAFDKNLQGAVRSGTARNLNGLLQQGIDAGPDTALHIYGHSQGGLLTWVAIKGLDFSQGKSPEVQLNTIQLSGAPVDAIQFHKDADTAGFEFDDQRAFQVNRPDETVFFGLLPKTDTVSDLPLLLGGNARYSDDPVARTLGALFAVTSLFGEDSPHSNYACVTCKPSAPGSVDTQVRDIVIKSTMIDSQGSSRRLE